MYLVFDSETETHVSYKRKANMFDKRNYIVAHGWKKQGDARNSWRYYPKYDRTNYVHIDDDVTYLVGFNIKFDLLWEMAQGNPTLLPFFQRGGKIWDCQYVEYFLGAQAQEVQMCSLNDTAPKYGGTTKIDAVKALWEQGVLTSDIPEDLLIDYLVGTEEEDRNGGDIGNTEKTFLGQIAKVQELGMLKMIEDRMDGLLGTTEMEFRGLKIDVAEAGRRLAILTEDLRVADLKLTEFIPNDLPFEFNWNSKFHSSALIFGGTVKYKKSDTYIDDNTGQLARLRVKETHWILEDGTTTDLPPGDNSAHMYAKFLGGKRKGEYKTKQVDAWGELKTKIQEFQYAFPGYTQAKEEWATKNEDALGAPIYSTNSDVMEVLAKRDLPFTKALGQKQKLDKEIGTYYVRFDAKKGEYVGMLSCVQTDDHIIHHNLNHTSTVTTRLSSSNPNLQNLPRNDKDDAGVQKSQVKQMFVSRFGADGEMIEADYSQLEVVVQGVLSKDPNLCEDLRNKIDFHCKRVSAKHKITYEQAVGWCKNGVSMPALEASGYVGKVERTKCKIFSFQRAYGAGEATVAEETGMTLEETHELFLAEDALYPGVVLFNKEVEDACMKSARPFQAVNDNGEWQTFRRGYWQAPTGTLYSWRTYEAKGWQVKRGIKDSFNPPELKNYPIQGTGGEFVQAIIGLLWRHFIANNFYGGKAFLVNTVHDCVWVDSHKDVRDQVCRDVKRIMESIPEFYNNRYNMGITVPFPVEVEHGPNMNTLGHFHEPEAKAA
ncbi:DNA polymerase I protein [Rhizobium phage RHph_X3_9]|nr:DNA polymerase I protein [Rhizobium phage RHph_X3_9]